MSYPLQPHALSVAVIAGLIAALMCQCQLPMQMHAGMPDSEHCPQHAPGTAESPDTDVSDCCAMGTASVANAPMALQAPTEVHAVVRTPLPVFKSARPSDFDPGLAFGPPGGDCILHRTCNLLI